MKLNIQMFGGRGASSSQKYNDNEYYYHNTSKELLKEIKKTGLTPMTDVGNEYGLFLGENDNRKEISVYGDVELRFLKSKVKNTSKYIGNYYTNEKINVSDIEIKDKKTNKWKKLSRR